MAKRKYKSSSIEIEHKFETIEEAVRFQKRLIEFIRYTCKKKQWSCQAIIGVSDLKSYATNAVHHEKTGKVGRPRLTRIISDYTYLFGEGLEGRYGKVHTKPHLHVFIVANPGEAVAQSIVDFINKKWHANNVKITARKKNRDFNNLSYYFNQCENIRFCNEDHSLEPAFAEGMTLKELYTQKKIINKDKEYGKKCLKRKSWNKLLAKQKRILDYFNELI